MTTPTLQERNLLSEEKWFILYTAPKAEKSVYNQLLKQDFKAYLPTFKSTSFWKNRQKKIIEKPLFTSYVFTKAFEKDLFSIIQVPRVVTYLRTGSKPSIISEKEIDLIRNMSKSGTDISIEPNLVSGEKVRIVSGPFDGYEGILEERNGKSHFGVQLAGLKFTLFIELDASCLEKLS